MIHRDIGHDRRLTEVALAIVDIACRADDPFTAAQDGARSAEFLAEFRERAIGSRIDDRAHPVLLPSRVAHPNCRRLGHEKINQLVIYRTLNEDSTIRRALLPLQAEGTPDDARSGTLQIRVARHNGRVLPAHFRNAWAGILALGK